MAEFNLQSAAFPVLDDAQTAQLAGCVKIASKKHADGEVLVAVGERTMKFFIVNSSQTSAFPPSSRSTMASFFDDALTAEKSPFCQRQR